MKATRLSTTEGIPVKMDDNNFDGTTQVIGLCVGMVTIRKGNPDKVTKKSVARVSIVNYSGQTLYDTFVSPRGKVVDYCLSN